DPEYSQTLLLVSCEGMADSKQINQYVLPRLEQMIHGTKFEPAMSVELDLNPLKRSEIVNCVFSGHLLIHFKELDVTYSLDIGTPPNRTPEESSIDIAIRGPRDNFIENVYTNVALVRKRLRTTSMRYEHFVIGTRSETAVALL